MLRRRAVAVALAATGLLACNAILGIEARPLRPDDASDASDARDAAPSPTLGDSASSPCTAAGVKFCDDFESATFAHDWTKSIDDGASLERTSPGFESTGALAAKAPSEKTAALMYAGRGAPRVVVAFDVRFQNLVNGSVLQYFRFSVDDQRFATLTLYPVDGHVLAELSENTPEHGFRQNTLQPPPTDDWIHVEVRLGLDAGSMSVAWNHEEAQAAPSALDPGPGYTIEIGALNADDASQDFLFDNVVVTAP